MPIVAVFGRHDGTLKLLDDEQISLVGENDMNQVEAMLRSEMFAYRAIRWKCK